jgi:ribonuclease E
MKRMLVNANDSEECRIAIVEDGKLSELYVEISDRESYLGNIYKGKVVNIEPSIGAAFVNFGGNRNGFLHASDVIPAYADPDVSLIDILEGRARAGKDEGPDAVRAVLSEDGDPEDRESGQGYDAASSDARENESADESAQEPQAADDAQADDGGAEAETQARRPRRRSQRENAPEPRSSDSIEDGEIEIVGDDEEDAPREDAPRNERGRDSDVSFVDDESNEEPDERSEASDDGDLDEERDDSSSGDADSDTGEGSSSKRRRRRRSRRKKGESKEGAAEEGAQPVRAKGRRGKGEVEELGQTETGKKRERGDKKGRQRTRVPIQDLLKKGQEVIVQITKEGIGAKGPTLTTYLSLPGRCLVLMPSLPKCGVSRKIADDRERRRLKRIVRELDRTGHGGIGFIVRTAGVGKTGQDVQRDLEYLEKLWGVVVQRAKGIRAPASLYVESDLVLRTMRDHFTPDIDDVVIDSEPVYKRVRDFVQTLMPRFHDAVKHHEGRRRPSSTAYGIEHVEVQKGSTSRASSCRPVAARSLIDQTEALVAIDVNSGKFKPGTDTRGDRVPDQPRGAIPEIVRQLRLRDLGGLIVMRLHRHDGPTSTAAGVERKLVRRSPQGATAPGSTSAGSVERSGSSS